ncbi:MAG: undecaprenyl-diphosphate phosphatase [Nannocystaceae bacterium]|nr:undecaprenyl-diphosphate phosphatase [Nannocystaceae bacterium]
MRLAVLGFAVLVGIASIAVSAVCAAAVTAPETAASLSLAVAALLGALQGATEFLPVSSSGHLALAQAWLHVDPDVAGHRFNIVLHAGTLLAVLWLYRQDVRGLAGVVLRPTADTPERRMLLAMFVATLPLGLALGLEPIVVTLEQSPRYVGAALLLTAAIVALSFRRSGPVPETPNKTPPALPRALAIGLAQLIAIVPGISRSGSTIAAGLALKLDREQAARFSFLISIPAIGGATTLEVLKVIRDPSDGAIPWLAYGVGFLTSFGVGLLCLRWLLALVRGGKITGFVVYLLILGTAAIVFG